MIDFDAGPTQTVARHFAALPPLGAYAPYFWADWGPVFYRGRLNRGAKILCIASDPGPTERIAGRTLVGDAGQRVQGFLAKLGLTHSYLLLNAHPYALLPSQAQKGQPLLNEPDHLAWRNRLFDLTTGYRLQAVVAFGVQARVALRAWEPRGGVPTFEIPHPSSRDPRRLANEWRGAITSLRGIVDRDPGDEPALPNYGEELAERDYQRIPFADLPYGLPDWFGDDSAVRAEGKNNRVERDRTDFMHKLVWTAPKGEN